MVKPYGRFRVPEKEEGLPFRANPSPCDELKDVEAVDRMRQTLCINQAACCTFAASQDWDGFHCLNCYIFEPMTREEQRLQLEGLATLLTHIFWEPLF